MQQEPAQREAGPDSGRATARAALDAALAGVELTATDKRFLTRLSQWDKRTATTVASLVMRARESGCVCCSPPALRAFGEASGRS